MIVNLNTTMMAVCVWDGGGGCICGIALGAGLSPTQVINTLINSSAHHNQNQKETVGVE